MWPLNLNNIAQLSIVTSYKTPMWCSWIKTRAFCDSLCDDYTTADRGDNFCEFFEWERVRRGQLRAVMICQWWASERASGASAEGLWMWIKVQLSLMVSAALFTKSGAIDSLLVLSLHCANRRFPPLPHSPTMPPRRMSYSHTTRLRNKKEQCKWSEYSHVEM